MKQHIMVVLRAPALMEVYVRGYPLILQIQEIITVPVHLVSVYLTLSLFIALFHSLVWIELKWPGGGGGEMVKSMCS